MAFWHILIVLSVVFAIGWAGMKFSVSFYKKRMQLSDDLDLSIGFVLFVGLLIGSFFFTHLLPASLIFGIYAILAMGIVCLVFVSSHMPRLTYAGFMTGICFLSTYFLPSDFFSDNPLMGVGKHLFLAIAWVMMIWIFSKMDRVPFFSMIFTTSIAFFMFLLSGFFTALPAAFGYLAMTVLLAQMGVNMYLKRYALPRLGLPAATLIGYLLAFFVIYLMAMGYNDVGVILYAYPTMEIVLAAGTSFGLYHFFSLQPPFLMEQALSKNIMPNKVFRSVMMWGLLTAGLGVLSVISDDPNKYIYYFALIIILINIYIRLNGWGVPTPRLRDVGRDLKEGFKEVKKELSTIPIKKTDVKLVSLTDELPPKKDVVSAGKIKENGDKIVQKKNEPKKSIPLNDSASALPVGESSKTTSSRVSPKEKTMRVPSETPQNKKTKSSKLASSFVVKKGVRKTTK